MTDPQQVAHWWGPKGGAYRIAMQPAKGNCFTWLVSISRCSRRPAWPTGFAGSRPTLTTARPWRAWHCTRDGATEVALTQGAFATAARCELHKAGWTDTLARLASHLAQA